jgi:hypothetical protein
MHVDGDQDRSTTQTLQLHTRRSTVGSARQGLRIVRLVWLGSYFDTEIRSASAGATHAGEMRTHCRGMA